MKHIEDNDLDDKVMLVMTVPRVQEDLRCTVGHPQAELVKEHVIPQFKNRDQTSWTMDRMK
jgi:hypothetical protein